MGTGRFGYVQCQCCGHTYQIDYSGGATRLPLEASIVNTACPSCGREHGINCGEDISDYYYYANPVMDERYY